MNSLISSVAPEWYVPTVFLTIGLAFGVVVSLRPRFTLSPADPLTFWVPFGFHAYCLAAGLLSLALVQTPFLLGMSLAMLALALYLHRAIFRSWLGRIPVRQPQ